MITYPIMGMAVKAEVKVIWFVREGELIRPLCRNKSPFLQIPVGHFVYKDLVFSRFLCGLNYRMLRGERGTGVICTLGVRSSKVKCPKPGVDLLPLGLCGVARRRVTNHLVY